MMHWKSCLQTIVLKAASDLFPYHNSSHNNDFMRLGWSDIRGIEDLAKSPPSVEKLKSFRSQKVLSGSECPMWPVMKTSVHKASTRAFGGSERDRMPVGLTAISSFNVPPQGKYVVC